MQTGSKSKVVSRPIAKPLTPYQQTISDELCYVQKTIKEARAHLDDTKKIREAQISSLDSLEDSLRIYQLISEEHMEALNDEYPDGGIPDSRMELITQCATYQDLIAPVMQFAKDSLKLTKNKVGQIDETIKNQLTYARKLAAELTDLSPVNEQEGPQIGMASDV